MKLLGRIMGNILIFLYRVVLIILIGIAILGCIITSNITYTVKDEFSEADKAVILNELGIVNSADIDIIHTKTAYRMYNTRLTAKKDAVSFFTENMGLSFSETGLVSFCEDIGLYKSSMLDDNGKERVGYKINYDKLKKYVDEKNYFVEMTIYVEDSGIEVVIYKDKISSADSLEAMKNGANPNYEAIKFALLAGTVIIVLAIPLFIIDRKRYKREMEDELVEEEEEV